MRFGTLLGFLLSLLSGCASAQYARVEKGTLQGKLIVQWIDADQFIFIPDSTDPLTFTRSNGDRITPGKMYTDGGSIPRPLWAFRNYSPWGYGPAFVVHDWLFDMHHCQLPGHEKYTLDDAAMVMAEVMKTMMEETDRRDSLTLYAMYEAVRSPIAKDLWDNGTCNQPKVTAAHQMFLAAPPAAQYVIQWPPPPPPPPGPRGPQALPPHPARPR